MIDDYELLKKLRNSMPIGEERTRMSVIMHSYEALTSLAEQKTNKENLKELILSKLRGYYGGDLEEIFGKTLLEMLKNIKTNYILSDTLEEYSAELSPIIQELDALNVINQAVIEFLEKGGE